MNNSNTFRTMTAEEDAAFYAQEEKRLALEDAQIRNAPSRPLHENMKRLRAKFELSQSETAEIMGISERAYRTYEKGHRPIPSDALLRLATATGVDLNEIMLGRPQRPDPAFPEKFYSDIETVREVLRKTYPKMDDATQFKAARFAVTHDWRPFYTSLTDPDMIRDAVIITTDYQFHPEEAPAPPFWENFPNDEIYESAYKDWLDLFGHDPEADEVDEPKSAI